MDEEKNDNVWVWVGVAAVVVVLGLIYTYVLVRGERAMACPEGFWSSVLFPDLLCVHPSWWVTVGGVVLGVVAFLVWPTLRSRLRS